MRTRRPMLLLVLLAVVVGACDSGATGQHLSDAPGPDQLTADAVTTGWEHTCALRSDGTVQCWGNNRWGQLGDGSTMERHTPVAVDGLTGAVAVTAGRGHTCALREGGTVACWGDNEWGQLGDGTTAERRTPVAVDGLTDAVGVAAGPAHMCALREGGSVACWGDNQWGQLGDGTTADHHTPVAVDGLTDAVGVSTGFRHTCARREGGTVVCWGDSTAGQLGDGSSSFELPTPVAVRGLGWRTGRPLADAVVVSAGGSHTCALREGGFVACWGDNDARQLADGTTLDSRHTPATVERLVDAVAVSAGGAHTCALRQGGAVVCWGLNDAGQLGDGSTATRRTPTPVIIG